MAYRAQKFRQVVDLAPVHDDYVKLVDLDHRQGRRRPIDHFGRDT